MLIRNFASKSMADYIESIITDDGLHWNYRGFVTYDNINNKAPNDFQFTHGLYSDGVIYSELFEIARMIVHVFEAKTGIDVKGVIRAKVNLMVCSQWSDEELNDAIHVDSDSENAMSLIYYVVDSDGDTVIYDYDKTTVNEMASPIKGNLVYFKSNMPHRPTPPRNHKRRLVINIVIET